MEDISFYNRKYNTIESLITAKGDLNTAIVRRPWFCKLDIYRKIIEDSSYLDAFKDMVFKDRFTILRNGIELEKCPVCGKPYVHVSKSQNTYRTCNHKFNYNYELSIASRKRSEIKRKELFSELMLNENKILTDSVFNGTLNSLFNANDNYAFMMHSENYEFYHDLILKTSGAIPFSEGDPRISERMYLAFNGIERIPNCMYCGERVYFNNRFSGYSKTCRRHRNMLGRETVAAANREMLSDSINHDKYEVLEYPNLMTVDKLVVRCRKCGHTSEWIMKNGRSLNVHDMPLCRNCEKPQSCKEESLFEYVRSIYGGTIVHHNGSRKIIPPYELDMYLPDLNLAIEFDGIYFHSEIHGGKDRSYHLKKTDMCESKGIRLIHVFENEWVRNNKIVKSRIRNLLGRYDTVVYARKCRVTPIDNATSVSFQDGNHIQGGINASVNLGLFFGDELVSVMTFRKPRMNRKFEWELLRFCNKCGYHVIGGAGKLLSFFERNYNPKSVVSYADRRWSVGNLYLKLGFALSHSSVPNYWYFKTNNILRLENRMKFQKYRLGEMLDSYDDKLSEVENMRNNGYDRIFDCGNLVFVKNYK